MDKIIFHSFLSVLIPFLLLTIFVKKQLRGYLLMFLAGAAVCLSASQTNGYFLQLINNPVYVITTISPMIEEIAKALPILVFAFFFKEERGHLLQISFFVGLGYGVVENIALLCSNPESFSVMEVFHFFGAGCMQAVGSVLVGYGISVLRENGLLLFFGAISFLIMAILFHGIVNFLFQSELEILGSFLPMVIVFVSFVFHKKGRKTIWQ